MKIIFSKTREKYENLDINIVIFKEEFDLLRFIKKKKKIPEMKVSIKIFKLTY